MNGLEFNENGPEVNHSFCVPGARWLLLLPTIFVAVSSCSTASPSVRPCVFPGPPRSAVASGMPMAGDAALRGRVLNIASVPVEAALVRLDPGTHFAQTDSLGWFRFADVPHGRYRVAVQTIGFVEASDSVTYGEYGLEILVALAPYEPGLLECVRIYPGQSRPAHRESRRP
jgi:hypothetical protein